MVSKEPQKGTPKPFFLWRGPLKSREGCPTSAKPVAFTVASVGLLHPADRLDFHDATVSPPLYPSLPVPLAEAVQPDTSVAYRAHHTHTHHRHAARYGGSVNAQRLRSASAFNGRPDPKTTPRIGVWDPVSKPGCSGASGYRAHSPAQALVLTTTTTTTTQLSYVSEISRETQNTTQTSEAGSAACRFGSPLGPPVVPFLTFFCPFPDVFSGKSSLLK